MRWWLGLALGGILYSRFCDACRTFAIIHVMSRSADTESPAPWRCGNMVEMSIVTKVTTFLISTV